MTTISNIDVLAELEAFGWKYTPLGKDEVRVLCPKHKDTEPSASLNIRNKLWNCHVCKGTGDFITFLAYATRTPRMAVIQLLSEKYDLEDEKSIPADTAEKFHQDIFSAGPLLESLRERGITDNMIRAARLGYYDGRITIPVYDAQGRILNIRRYLPGAPTKQKMKNTKGFGKVRLYQVADIKDHNNIIVAGGEMKSLVLKHLLNEHGFGAVSATAGEGSWDVSWNPLFKGKKVWIVMDIDPAGQKAARDIAENLFSTAEELYVVQLPLDKEKYPKGDVNDYVGREHAGSAELLRLFALAPRFEPGNVQEDVEKGIRDTRLERATSPDNVGWRLRFEAVVSAMDTTPYLVPKDVLVSCTRNQPHCATCPIMRTVADERGFVKQTVKATSRGLLEMVNVAKLGQQSAIKDALNIPKCAIVEFEIESHYAVNDVRLAPQLQISSESGGNVQQPAFVVGFTPDLNTPYILEGRVYPHPKTQQATLVIDKTSETVDSLSTFAPSETELESLNIFTPTEWTVEALQTKLDSIYGDLEQNVTRIYGRRDLHLAMDLAYHSPLMVDYDKKLINGWLNVLVCGDSSQGKSETAKCLRQHYQLGESVDCKNATVAGLLGGLQQMGTRWFVSWGVIPTHDQRLVVLEELKGAATDVIAKLTDMRSSGIAEIPKIERRRAHARTRLVALSNPRSNRPMSSYSFGIEAIHELIGSLEDIRRFDLALIVAAGQVDVMQMSPKSDISHIYTSELCRRLCLWAWTRRPKQVVVEQEAIDEINNAAQKLCERYTEALPLVDRGTIRHKLARISAALAARTFSRDGDTLVVRVCHVQYVVGYIDRLYSDRCFGYSEYTQAQTALNLITETKAVEKFILKLTKHPLDLVRGMLYRDDITQVDIQDWCEVDRDTAQTMISFLVRTHCLKRHTRSSYVKTSDFITMLKRLQTVAQATPERNEDPF